MHAYFAEPNQVKRDAIALRQLPAVKERVKGREKAPQPTTPIALGVSKNEDYYAA